MVSGRKNGLTGLLVLLTACLLGSCSPTSPSRPDRDLIELERVWQFLRVYSIWQERIPQDPFVFAQPRQLALAIHDTLFGNNYTQYFEASPVISGGALAYEALQLDTLPTVRYERLTARTARITVESFRDTFWHAGKKYPSTEQELYASTLKDTSRNIIIDLRGNGGGSVDVCTSMVEGFLPAGVEYLSSTYRYYNDTTKTASTIIDRHWKTNHTGGRFENRTIAVLVDSGSASASEIFAAALRDGLGPEKVLLIGTRTYGKGIGQFVVRFMRTSGAGMQITGMTFKRLTGDSLVDNYHRRGIYPDIQSTEANLGAELATWFKDPELATVRFTKSRRFPYFKQAWVEVSEGAIP